MENEERSQIKAHYQKEIESIKGEVARLTNLLEQALSFKNGKETSAQAPVEALSANIPRTSQNLRANSINGKHFVHYAIIQPTQTHIIMDLIIERRSDDRSTGPIDHDKWVVVTER
jgi:hypothetical protein